jgi:uncharacterized membrane protein
MKCPKCSTESDETANYCKNCGNQLLNYENTEKRNKKSEIIILIFLVFSFVSELIRCLIININKDWFFEPILRYSVFAVSLMFGLSFVLLSLTIKNKTRKIAGIVIYILFAMTMMYMLLNLQFTTGISV